MKRFLCIALHDVAPATWPQCARLLAMLDELGAAHLTLLVVPNFHGLGSIEQDPIFLAAIEARRARGDEVALHGFTHQDDAPPPRTLAQWLQRRLLTAREGEFAALNHSDARRRIDDGLAMFSRLNWPNSGFVPPAWLAGEGAQKAVCESPLLYTSTHRSLIDLRSGQAIDAPVITASSRSAWRRVASRIWMRALRLATKNAELLRIGLHPIDADYPKMLRSWRLLINKLLADHTPVTKFHALALARSARDAGQTGFDVSGKSPSEF